jgi:hypothetical protein
VADEEFAGGRARGNTDASSPPQKYDIGKGDAEDDEWLESLARKNKREARAKYGGDPDPKDGGKGKGKKGRESAGAAAKKEDRKNDPCVECLAVPVEGHAVFLLRQAPLLSSTLLPSNFPLFGGQVHDPRFFWNICCGPRRRARPRCRFDPHQDAGVVRPPQGFVLRVNSVPPV